MVQRTYQAPQFGTRDTREYQGRGVQGADTRPNVELQVGDTQWRDRLLEGVFRDAKAVADKAVDVGFSNAYLEGQAAVGIAQSEEELQGNPLTRDWKVAGYRDTMGKLALADAEANFMQDLPSLRTKEPSEFQAYLSNRRQKLTPALSSMSREARAATAGQMLMQDRSATKHYTSERTKYILEEKSRGIITPWNVNLRSMQATQLAVATGEVEPATLDSQIQTAAAGMYTSVWLDPALPETHKRDISTAMVMSALDSDNLGLYDYLQNAPNPEDGKTLMSRLDGEQQLKLSKAYREAEHRTKAKRNVERVEQIARYEAEVKAGTFKGTYEDVKNTFRAMVFNETIPQEKYESLVGLYLEHQLKFERSGLAADALQRGDDNALFNMGKSHEQAAKDLDLVMRKNGTSPEVRLQTWLRTGEAGVDVGYTKAGEILGTTLGQIITSKDGNILPQHLELFRAVGKALGDTERPGYANSRSRLLSGLREEDRMFAEQIFRRVDSGASTEEAIQRSRAAVLEDAQLTPAAKAARASSNAGAISKSIGELDPRGAMESLWLHLKSPFSAGATADLALKPKSMWNARDNFFGDSQTVQFYMEQYKTNLRREADNVMMLRPLASPEEVMSVAKAGLMARTISTENGPVILPRGINMEATFGVGPGNQVAIGKAIDGILKDTKADSRWQIAFDQGRMFAQEFDKNGTRIGNGQFIDPTNIQARIKEDTAKAKTEAAQTFGPGKTAKVGDASVTYNGENTAGAPAEWMVGFRDNLVNNEGVRSSAYKDTAGVETIGVGIARTNTFYPKPGPDGKISDKAINDSFVAASNAAAKHGLSIAKAIGRGSAPAFQLFSELSYQSGPAFLNRKDSVGESYRKFTTAVRTGTLQEAREAMQNTAAFLASAPARQNHYLNLVAKVMNQGSRRSSGTVTPMGE